MWILNMYSLKEWTYYGEISLSPRSWPTCLKTWMPTLASAPDRCLYIPRPHTLISTSLCRCATPPTETWCLEFYFSVSLFPFNVTSLCRLLPALTCFLQSVLRSSAFLRLTASWLISKWHLNTVFKKKMFVNHVTSFSQPDMECLLYYSVFNKKKTNDVLQ